MKSNLVVVSYVDADQKARMESVLREHQGRLTTLQMAATVRALGAIAPLRCPCGCRQVVSHEAMAERIERTAVLS